MQNKELNLLTELRKDARCNVTKIARRIQAPVSTVHDRLKKLQDRLVTKYTCLLDFRKLGFNTRAHLIIRLAKKEEREEVKEHLLRQHNVNSVYKINNGYDFLAELVFRDMGGLDDFLQVLEEKFKIKEKKVYYIIDDVAREQFLSDQIHAQIV